MNMYIYIFVDSHFGAQFFGRLIFARCHDFGWPCAASKGAVGELSNGLEKQWGRTRKREYFEGE